MLVAPERHIAVDLVGDDEDVAVVAEVGQSGQRVFVPHDAGRVVGVREDKHLALVVSHLGQVVEVHRVGAVGVLVERVVDYLAAVSLWRQPERVVDGRLDDDLVARLGEDVHHHADALHDAGYVGEPFALYVPLMVVFQPLLHGGPIVFWLHSVAEERVGHSLAQRVGDEMWCLKVHVGHP